MLAWAVAVLLYVAQLWDVVELVIWTVALADGARSPKEQESVWLGGDPVIEQVPGPE